ncbi:unnamed protein product, partial [Meganyctiphanes norvegica]
YKYISYLKCKVAFISSVVRQQSQLIKVEHQSSAPTIGFNRIQLRTVSPSGFDSPSRSSSNTGLRLAAQGISSEAGSTHRFLVVITSSNKVYDSKQEQLQELIKDEDKKIFFTSHNSKTKRASMVFLQVFLYLKTLKINNITTEFSVLLQTNPPRLTTIHLLQILAINMFAVENTEIKDPGVGATYRSAAQELALVLAQEMFGRMAELAVQLFPVHFQGSMNSHKQQQPQQKQEPLPGSDPERLFTPVLAHFMPAIKTWCDWLMYFSCVWNPPPSALEYQCKLGNTWSSVAALATIVRGLGYPDVPILDTKDSEELIPIRLNEDNFLRGYEPVMKAHKKTYYTSQYSHTGRAEDWLRVQQLQTSLCQFLCGIDPPVLRLQKTASEDFVLVSVVDTSRPDTPTSDGLTLSISDIEDSESLSESDEDAEEEYDDNHGSVDDET